MARDVERAKRIANVLQLLERAGRRDLVEATRSVDDAKRAHDEVLASLAADEFLSGPFIDLIAKRLPRLAVDVEIKEQQKARAMRLWQGQQMRVMASERLVADAEIDADRDREGRDLESLLEILHVPSVQGSGKSRA